MYTAAYSFLFGTTVLLASDVVPWPGTVQYGALAILAWAVWYMLARAFPQHIKAQQKERDAFLAAQADDRKAFLESQTLARREFRDALDAVVRAKTG